MRNVYDEQIDENRIGEVYKKEYDKLVSLYTLEKFFHYINCNNCLEVGSYDGSITEKLLLKYNDLVALDASQKACSLLKKKLKNNKNKFRLINNEVEIFITSSDLVFENRLNIYMMNVLEHIKRPKDLLIALNCKLKSSSRLFIQVPNVNSLSRQIASKMGLLNTTYTITDFEKACGHYSNFSIDSLESMIIDSGFNIINSFGTGLKPFSSSQIDRALECNIINQNYIKSLFKIDSLYPNLCGSICCIAEKN